MINELAPLISHYGFIIIILGMMIEGTTMVIAVGVICYLGLMPLSIAIISSITGAILGDWFWYFVGRNYASFVISKFPSLKEKIDSLNDKIQTKGNILAFLERYIYGGALLFPIALGVDRYPFKKYVIFESIGTTLWAILGVGLGYLLGSSAQEIFGKIEKIEHLLAVIIVISVIIWIIKRKFFKHTG